MGKRRTGWSNVVLNVTMVALGLAVLVLLYALIRSNVLPSAPTSGEVEPGEDIIQVEVRNGCGVSGLAEGMRAFLIQEGFDVVEVGNYTSFNQPQTLVIDRVGNLEAARRVAASLGLSEEQVKQELRQDYFLDASVIIGQDYATLPPFADASATDADASATDE